MPLADKAAFSAGSETDLRSLNWLGEAYPNPFNSATTLSVNLPQASDLRLAVYNVAGQQAVYLANGYVEAGRHTYTFDGSSLASGEYFVRAMVPGHPDADCEGREPPGTSVFL